MSGIRSAVLAGLVVVLGMPSIALTQSAERMEALVRGLGADASAEILEGFIPKATSKEEATSRDEALFEDRRAAEVEEAEEEREPRIEGGETLLIAAIIDQKKFPDEGARDAASQEFASDIYRAKFLGRNTFASLFRRPNMVFA